MFARTRAIASCLLLSCSVTASALAAGGAPIGSAVAVQEVVTGEFSRNVRTISVGDRVLQDETLEVSRAGFGEFKLDDQTKLALGAGARLTLDKFVYDPRRDGGSIALNFVTGAFRFVTGLASKSAYVIRLPAASITVRGTIFDVFVEESGRSWLLLHEGGVQACNSRGTCRVVSEPGTLIRIDEDGALSKPARWASLAPRDLSFDEAFPFVGKPPSIDPKPVFTRDALLEPEAPKGKKKAEKAEPEETAPGKRTRQAAAYPDASSSDEAEVAAPVMRKPKLPRAMPDASEYLPQGDGDGDGGYLDHVMKKAERYAPKIVERVREQSYEDHSDDDEDTGSAMQSGIDPYRTPGTSMRPRPRSGSYAE